MAVTANFIAEKVITYMDDDYGNILVLELISVSGDVTARSPAWRIDIEGVRERFANINELPLIGVSGNRMAIYYQGQGTNEFDISYPILVNLGGIEYSGTLSAQNLDALDTGNQASVTLTPNEGGSQ